jgi:hypothetical protein
MKRLMEIQIPRSLAIDVKGLTKAIKDGIDATAEACRVDFVATTNTWKHKPKFIVKPESPMSRIIYTDDDVWNMLEVGTRPHIIKPKPTNRSGMLRFAWDGFGSYGAKTTPGSLSSKNARYPKKIVRRRFVKHPGTKARKWTIVAKQKYAKLMPKIMQRAIDAQYTRGGSR